MRVLCSQCCGHVLALQSRTAEMIAARPAKQPSLLSETRAQEAREYRPSIRLANLGRRVWKTTREKTDLRGLLTQLRGWASSCIARTTKFPPGAHGLGIGWGANDLFYSAPVVLGGASRRFRHGGIPRNGTNFARGGNRLWFSEKRNPSGTHAKAKQTAGGRLMFRVYRARGPRWDLWPPLSLPLNAGS